MAKQLQLRRGTTAQHATFTGAVGEVTIDTDKDVVVVHDGATAGGFPSQKQLVSGTNIKTVNSTTLLGSGDIAVQPTLVSGTNIKTINNSTILGSGNINVVSAGMLTGGTTNQVLAKNSNTDYDTKWYSVQDTLVSGTNIKTINSTTLLGSGDVPIYTGLKNYIINGNFDVWQRGTSFTGLTNGSYSADRWVVYGAIGNINYNIIRNAGVFTCGYGATYTWNSGTGTRSIIQFIENVTKFKVGSNVTVQFEAYTNSTPYSIDVGIQGARGVWTAATSVNSASVSITNTKTKYSVTLSVPDWNGLGIDWAHLEDTKLALKFDFGADTNGKDFIIGNVQLEEGSVATPFEQRPYGLELSLCQRYYEVIPFIYTIVASNVGFGGNQYHPVIKMATEKRVMPTVILYDQNLTPNKVTYYTGATAHHGVSYTMEILNTKFIGIVSHYTTDGGGLLRIEKITASSEL